MADADTGELAAMAERAVRAGGAYLGEAFRDGPVEADDGADDVKAVADREAERRVLAEIESAFPDHAVYSEESGRGAGDGYRWVVDPLDGTNNFASGLPAFASAVAVVEEATDEPVVSAVYEPLPDSLYLAVRGEGATVGGDPLDAANDRALERATVSVVVGLPAVRDTIRRAEADRIEAAVGDACKRVVETWAPCVDWGLLARGSLEGIVCVYPDVYEQYAGSLLAAEAGAAAEERNGVYVAAGDGDRAARLADIAADART